MVCVTGIVMCKHFAFAMRFQLFRSAPRGKVNHSAHYACGIAVRTLRFSRARLKGCCVNFYGGTHSLF